MGHRSRFNLAIEKSSCFLCAGGILWVESGPRTNVPNDLMPAAWNVDMHTERALFALHCAPFWHGNGWIGVAVRTSSLFTPNASRGLTMLHCSKDAYQWKSRVHAMNIENVTVVIHVFFVVGLTRSDKFQNISLRVD